MEHTVTTKLEPDAHLLLDQPLLRVPHEYLRKGFKTSQRHVEQANKNITKDVQAAASQQGTASLASLDAALAKARNLKRKLEQLHAEEIGLHRQQRLRIEHLQQLHDIPSLADVKYDNWAHTRLDRLLIDHLLRSGHMQTAKELAAEKGIGDLVDIPLFEESAKIVKSLQAGKTKECLTWCTENKQALKKINSNLEQELRIQEIIELSRSGDLQQVVDAVAHARKYLTGTSDSNFSQQAGGIIAYSMFADSPETLAEPFRTQYSPQRYNSLADLFIKAHHDLFALPDQPLLHTALSAGLSALKTPSCHSAFALEATANTGAPVCPICSTELNELARNVPYAHHTRSHMEEYPVVLPNGRVFGLERLMRLNEKLGTKPGRVKDPTKDPTDAANEWDEDALKKVFIS